MKFETKKAPFWYFKRQKRVTTNAYLNGENATKYNAPTSQPPPSSSTSTITNLPTNSSMMKNADDEAASSSARRSISLHSLSNVIGSLIMPPTHNNTTKLNSFSQSHLYSTEVDQENVSAIEGGEREREGEQVCSERIELISVFRHIKSFRVNQSRSQLQSQSQADSSMLCNNNAELLDLVRKGFGEHRIHEHRTTGAQSANQNQTNTTANPALIRIVQCNQHDTQHAHTHAQHHLVIRCLKSGSSSSANQNDSLSHTSVSDSIIRAASPSGIAGRSLVEFDFQLEWLAHVVYLPLDHADCFALFVPSKLPRHSSPPLSVANRNPPTTRLTSNDNDVLTCHLFQSYPAEFCANHELHRLLANQLHFVCVPSPSAVAAANNNTAASSGASNSPCCSFFPSNPSRFVSVLRRLIGGGQSNRSIYSDKSFWSISTTASDFSIKSFPLNNLNNHNPDNHNQHNYHHPLHSNNTNNCPSKTKNPIPHLRIRHNNHHNNHQALSSHPQHSQSDQPGLYVNNSRSYFFSQSMRSFAAAAKTANNTNNNSITGSAAAAPPLITFEQVLANENARNWYKKFLDSEVSAENIRFWEAVEEFKKCPAEQRLSKAQSIYATFIDPNGPDVINLDGAQIQKVRTDLQAHLTQQHSNTTKGDDEADEFDGHQQDEKRRDRDGDGDGDGDEQEIEERERRIAALFDASLSQTVKLMKSDSFPRFLKSHFYREFASLSSSSSAATAIANNNNNSSNISNNDATNQNRSMLLQSGASSSSTLPHPSSSSALSSPKASKAASKFAWKFPAFRKKKPRNSAVEMNNMAATSSSTFLPSRRKGSAPISHSLSMIDCAITNEAEHKPQLSAKDCLLVFYIADTNDDVDGDDATRSNSNTQSVMSSVRLHAVHLSRSTLMRKLRKMFRPDDVFDGVFMYLNNALHFAAYKIAQPQHQQRQQRHLETEAISVHTGMKALAGCHVCVHIFLVFVVCHAASRHWFVVRARPTHTLAEALRHAYYSTRSRNFHAIFNGQNCATSPVNNKAGGGGGGDSASPTFQLRNLSVYRMENSQTRSLRRVDCKRSTNEFNRKRLIIASSSSSSSSSSTHTLDELILPPNKLEPDDIMVRKIFSDRPPNFIEFTSSRQLVFEHPNQRMQQNEQQHQQEKEEEERQEKQEKEEDEKEETQKAEENEESEAVPSTPVLREKYEKARPISDENQWMRSPELSGGHMTMMMTGRGQMRRRWARSEFLGVTTLTTHTHAEEERQEVQSSGDEMNESFATPPSPSTHELIDSEEDTERTPLAEAAASAAQRSDTTNEESARDMNSYSEIEL